MSSIPLPKVLPGQTVLVNNYRKNHDSWDKYWEILAKLALYGKGLFS